MVINNFYCRAVLDEIHNCGIAKLSIFRTAGSVRLSLFLKGKINLFGKIAGYGGHYQTYNSAASLHIRIGESELLRPIENSVSVEYQGGLFFIHYISSSW